MTTLVNGICIPIVLGILATLVGWIITTVLMVPKFKIDNVERDFDGDPFIKIWNKSEYFNAYKVVVFIKYKPIHNNNNGKQKEYKKNTEFLVIEKNGCHCINLNINDKKVEDEMELNIYVVGHNKYGVATVLNDIKELKRIKAPEQ